MIYLLRHTKPFVEKHICYGQTDLDLDPTTKDNDISEALNRVAEIDFSKVYSSPLKRCRLLADIICKDRGIVDPILDNRLLETNFGDWEMKPWDDIFESQEGKVWFENYLELKVPNGESFSDLVERARCFFSSIDESENILIVTHDGFIRATLVYFGEMKKQNIFEEKYPYGVLKTINKK